jgi:hypothetical protein
MTMSDTNVRPIVRSELMNPIITELGQEYSGIYRELSNVNTNDLNQKLNILSRLKELITRTNGLLNKGDPIDFKSNANRVISGTIYQFKMSLQQIIVDYSVDRARILNEMSRDHANNVSSLEFLSKLVDACQNEINECILRRKPVTELPDEVIDALLAPKSSKVLEG